eukprot:s3250_g11.t1
MSGQDQQRIHEAILALNRSFFRLRHSGSVSSEPVVDFVFNAVPGSRDPSFRSSTQKCRRLCRLRRLCRWCPQGKLLSSVRKCFADAGRYASSYKKSVQKISSAVLLRCKIFKLDQYGS